MKRELSLSEQLTFSTTRIVTYYGNGNSGVGTGFFFQIELGNGKQCPCLVTNKHVIANAKSLEFLLTVSDEHGNPALLERLTVKYEFPKNWEWINHPDETVDLCILPIAPIVLQFQSEKAKHPFYRSLNMSLVPTQEEWLELTAVEDIVMVGYPIGLWDDVNNRPIVRRGITASHPAVAFKGKREFLIDAACFPGSSGSPVFLLNVGSYATRNGTCIGQRIKFLGVLYGGPQHTVAGEIKILEIPMAQQALAVSSIPMNLGFVIRSDRIREFEAILKQKWANELSSQRTPTLDEKPKVAHLD